MKFIHRNNRTDQCKCNTNWLRILIEDQTFTLSQMSSIQTKLQSTLMLCPNPIIINIAVADEMYSDVHRRVKIYKENCLNESFPNLYKLQRFSETILYNIIYGTHIVRAANHSVDSTLHITAEGARFDVNSKPRFKSLIAISSPISRLLMSTFISGI